MNNFEICNECGVNITLSDAHMRSCSKSVDDDSDSHTDTASYKFAENFMSVVRARTENALRANIISKGIADHSDVDACMENMNPLVSFAAATSALFAVQLMVEQNLLDPTAVEEIISAHDFSVEDFQ